MSTSVAEFMAPPVARWRRVGAVAAGALSLLALASAVLGAWNPTSLVVVHQHSGDPVRGLFYALALAVIAHWLGLPVSSEANQHRRLVARVWLIALAAVVGLAALVTLGLSVYRYQPQVIARSADGRRAVALVTVLRGRQLHTFARDGLGDTDQGSLGQPCGTTVAAHFVADDEIQVTTDFGIFDLRLDPATGRPLRGLSSSCSG
ncbi:hypothetical protein GCM10023322_16410 [Rugosimonospora acidiphila]|uniref:DUF1109 domain-containing protein n=1 Tax=Rugosimonospora acidiphila TaxID=556531 RepID=A0ABP9RPA7_9ACTN